MSIGTTIQPTWLVDKIGNRICTQDSRVQKTNFTTENLVPKIPKKIVITGVGKTPNEDPRRFAMNLFGTDGIRGTYGSTVTDGTAYLLGKSLALLGEDCPIVVVCRDTRTSGDKLCGALTAGVYDGGGNVINIGILPTNAVAHFVRKFGADFGVMITASHNPPTDNGLKVFDRYGVKLCSQRQRAVSALMNGLTLPSDKLPRVCEPIFYDIDNIYTEDVLRAVCTDLGGLRVALDCCYGACFRVATQVFVGAGADVSALNAKPCGSKVNVDCGATHADVLLDYMQRGNFHVGFTFDGDCDRLGVAEGTELVPNNKIYFAIAKYLAENGELKHDTAVGTVLTNGGVETALNKLGVTLLRSDVGDSNVFDMMAHNGLNFGGEESGHYLMSDFATGSDALVNAMFVAKIYRETGSLLRYTEECVDVPYMAESIPFDEQNAEIARPDRLAETRRRLQRLYPDCRIVLRKSGTENKLRVYIEGADAAKAMAEVAATYGK